MFGEINNIDIGFDVNEVYKEHEKRNKRKTEQRSDDWFNKRAGSWTGSKIKNIMACNRSASRMPWSDSEKIYEFSSGIVKYIYERAMERKTGRYTKSSGSAATKYGNIVERFIVKIGEELIDARIKEVGYKEFPDFPNAGASSDGVCEKLNAVIEIKACTNWQTHYDRSYSNTDEKSIDFWQTQAEMYAWSYDKCLYLVSEPPKDIMEYVSHPEAESLLDDSFLGDISELELFQKFKDECGVTVEEIKASKFHQKAMIERIKICEKVCTDWIEYGKPTGLSLDDLFWRIVDELKSSNDVNEIEVNEPETVKPVNETEHKDADEDKVNHRKSTLEIPPSFNDLPF